MRLHTVRTNQWLRYTTAVLALFWAVGFAAGCHLPHVATAAPGMPSRAAAAAGHDVATPARLAPADGGSCSPLDRACKHVAQACSTSDLVELAVVIAVVLAGSLAWPVVSAPRGPPQTAGFVSHRSGRNILTRFCIARI
ncbi:hypothetical protein A5773_12025 [Mycobacterium sp. 852014-52450_SCH5900713]|nr:hypothetical protein A5773_12025 [Mycobacterium sp. 852014-52450_SCH5900713]